MDKVDQLDKVDDGRVVMGDKEDRSMQSNGQAGDRDFPCCAKKLRAAAGVQRKLLRLKL
jgi:hypothetical protein